MKTRLEIWMAQKKRAFWFWFLHWSYNRIDDVRGWINNNWWRA